MYVKLGLGLFATSRFLDVNHVSFRERQNRELGDDDRWEFRIAMEERGELSAKRGAYVSFEITDEEFALFAQALPDEARALEAAAQVQVESLKAELASCRKALADAKEAIQDAIAVAF